jgi:hypothetical protein
VAPSGDLDVLPTTYGEDLYRRIFDTDPTGGRVAAGAGGRSHEDHSGQNTTG